MTKMWQVGPTGQQQHVHSPPGNGFGFTVQKVNTAESFTLVFDKEADAKKAKTSMRKLVEKASDVSTTS